MAPEYGKDMAYLKKGGIFVYIAYLAER